MDEGALGHHHVVPGILLAEAEELVGGVRVDALADVRLVGRRRREGRVRVRDDARERAARHRAGEAGGRRRVAEREGVEVDRGLAQPLLERRLVQVAEDAGLPARADGGGRAAEEEAQLAPGDLVGGGAAGNGDLGVPVEPLAPLVAVLVALAGVGGRRVVGVGDVVVGVDQPGRDDARRAGDHRGRRGRRQARRVGVAVGLAPHLGDDPGGVDQHLPAAVDPGRRQHRTDDEPPRVARGHRAHPARQRAQRLAHDHVARRGLRLAGRRAAVAAGGVAVVALLAGLDHAVAAHGGRRRLRLAGRRAAVAVGGVAVVALLAGLDHAVAAHGGGRHGGMAAAAGEGETAEQDGQPRPEGIQRAHGAPGTARAGNAPRAEGHSRRMFAPSG